MNKHLSIKLCLSYFVGYLILLPVFELCLAKLLDPQIVYRVLNAIEWGFYLAFPLFMIQSAFSWLKKEFYIFLAHPFKNVLKIVKTYGLMMLSSIALNLVLMLLFQLENSGNQSYLIDLFSKQPIKVIYAALIFAPIVEELVFRGALFSGFRKNQRLKGYLISSFAFGFLHVYQSLFSGNFKDLLFIFSYALLGSYICKAYDETGSMIGSMFLHFLNNLISVVVTFML